MITRLRLVGLTAGFICTILGLSTVTATAGGTEDAHGDKAATECNAHQEDDLVSFDIVSANKTGGTFTVDFLLTLKANVPYKTNSYNWADCPTTAADSNGYVWKLSGSEPSGQNELRPGMKLRGKLKFTRATGDVSANSFALSICRGFGPAEGPWSYDNYTYKFDAVPAHCKNH